MGESLYEALHGRATFDIPKIIIILIYFADFGAGGVDRGSPDQVVSLC